MSPSRHPTTAATSPALPLQVKRGEPELIAPAAPTPRELKPLSDIDDQEGLRFHVPFTFFYKSSSAEGNDAVSVVREALGRALVYYYPLAGRLREGPNRKLVLDCAGQGVLFIPASADIRFDQLGSSFLPPYPYLDDILYNIPGSDGILGCPVLLIQVTRLLCGGFIMALRLNHTISDAFGLVQFLKTMSEIAKGAKVPSTLPVWQRELLNARAPPRATCSHKEFQDLTSSTIPPPPSNGPIMTNFVQKSFFFGPSDIKAIRKKLPPNFPHASQFELLTACLWKCRTAALEFEPEQEVLVCSLVNARGKSFGSLRLPSGYYGNAMAYPAAAAKAGELSRNSLGFAVELVKKAKAEATEEYYRSVMDFLVIKGRPLYKTVGNFIVSCNRHVGYEEVDFGWGPPEFAGVATSSPVISFYMRYKREGEEGLVVPLTLPSLAMERFQQELKKMIT